ncbi:MAG: hypothetical protein ACOVP4_13490 [Bacteriovoracaceae bacterium]|jgi:hypothetical protein
MKMIFLGFLILVSFNSWSQSQSNIDRDLALLRDIGGAGNGGGGLALNISQAINRMAIEFGVKDIRSFSKSYRVLVGDYSFCDQINEGCSIAAKYFSDHKALLVDKKTWVTLSPEERIIRLELLMREIESAR